MALKKSDVRPGDEVKLTVDCYPEVGAPGIPQQLITVGIHKASELPDFAWERGYVIAVPDPKEEAPSKADEKPAAKTTKASPATTEST